jgi:H+/Cl- antiporter ClcA
MSQPGWFSTALHKFLSLFAPQEDERYGWSSHIRWPLLSVVVGIMAGAGAIFFEELLKLSLHHFLHLPTGYLEPIKGADPALISSLAVSRTWLYILIPTLGGLAAGLLVFLLAPEAEGHGTDAMIEAFHHAGGFIRQRVPPIKVLASALTIGSGGSAGAGRGRGRHRRHLPRPPGRRPLRPGGPVPGNRV